MPSDISNNHVTARMHVISPHIGNSSFPISLPDRDMGCLATTASPPDNPQAVRHHCTTGMVPVQVNITTEVATSPYIISCVLLLMFSKYQTSSCLVSYDRFAVFLPFWRVLCILQNPFWFIDQDFPETCQGFLWFVCINMGDNKKLNVLNASELFDLISWP